MSGFSLREQNISCETEQAREAVSGFSLRDPTPMSRRRLLGCAAVAGYATASAAGAPVATTINGHRAMLVGPRSASSGSQKLPPVILLGGTAQTLDSWQGHLTALSSKRKVLLYETRGQGGAFADGGLSLEDCSLEKHASDFVGVAGAAGLLDDGPVDVVAFSFGARVAMCAAANMDADATFIRRLCMTGTTADRGARGRLALRSWRAALNAGDLEGFAWRLILDTYSEQTLVKSEAQVAQWVNFVTSANSLEGIRAIVEQTHSEDPADPTHPLAMAKALRGSSAVQAGLLINGAEDMLSARGAGKALAEAAGWGFAEIAEAGHACPLEQPVQWRRAVTDFLSSP